MFRLFRYVMYVGIAVIIGLSLVILLFGSCAAVEVNRIEDEIQKCILSGGHPHLAPDGSIVCRF